MPERRVAAWVLAGLPLLPAAGPVPALEDPTRPPAYAPRQAPAPGTRDWRLEAVFHGPGGARALINGRLVAVGERVGGARVVAIGSRRVVLATDAGRRELRLVRARVLRHPAAPARRMHEGRNGP